MAGIVANKTKLSYKSGTGPNAFTEINYLMEVPELGAAPEKIDVTTLGDSVKKYITGMKDMGELVFKFLYENEDADSNFRLFKKMENEAQPVTFQIMYPDESAHEFDAVPSVKMDAGAINGALTFSVTMTVVSDFTITAKDGVQISPVEA